MLFQDINIDNPIIATGLSEEMLSKTCEMNNKTPTREMQLTCLVLL